MNTARERKTVKCLHWLSTRSNSSQRVSAAVESKRCQLDPSRRHPYCKSCPQRHSHLQRQLTPRLRTDHFFTGSTIWTGKFSKNNSKKLQHYPFPDIFFTFHSILRQPVQRILLSVACSPQYFADQFTSYVLVIVLRL